MNIVIDVVSDTVCPWCFIGKRRLAKAMASRPQITFDVRWRAYRLDPTVPPQGLERKAYLKARFGDDDRVRQMGESIREAGRMEDIHFAYERITRTPNTLDSHRLIRWAASAGVQDDVVERLFKAYFEEGRDIGSAAVLCDIAAEAGMNQELVARLIAEQADVELIEREDALAHQMGISGVPTFIFANRYAASGAQEPNVLLQIIDRLQDEASVVSSA